MEPRPESTQRQGRVQPISISSKEENISKINIRNLDVRVVGKTTTKSRQLRARKLSKKNITQTKGYELIQKHYLWRYKLRL
ncbi:hypothetical protein DYY67_1374 [Candidatus Nitrosotalea sp. TS]|nr:hypothetical protein [Candidatus Nitrosotalea sp. TS]